MPSGDEVPTTPGPIATMATSAWATWRARASADGTDTASRSPPNACPAVMVTSISPTRGHRVDEVGDHDRERGPVGHDVGDPRVRVGGADRGGHAGHLAVEAPDDHGHAAEVGGGRVVVLLGGAGVDLEARVAQLHDVAGTGFLEHLALGVPVDDVPAAGAEPEVDGGGVEHDPVADRDRRR